MKNRFKIIFPLLILIMISGPMLESMKAQDKIYIDFNVHIEWGRKSKGCKGFGLCIFITDVSIGGDISARMLPHKDILQLEFPLALVQKNPEQFENDIFIMGEDLEISDETSKDLGSDKPLRIPQGKYEVERTDYSVIVNISQE